MGQMPFMYSCHAPSDGAMLGPGEAEMLWNSTRKHLIVVFFLQCGPHPQWCERWFISPSNYSYCCTINHSYWSYVHQPSYRLGASHCKWQHVFRWRMCMMIVYVHSEELGFDVTSFTSVMFSSHVGPIMGMASFGWYRDAGVATMIAIPKHG